jgi:hypothetical protein
MEKNLKTKETKTQAIQRQIFDGRKVVIIGSRENKPTALVRIRYNNTDTNGTQKWRIIIDNEEYRTSEIKINCPTRTLTEKFEEIGEKHHIVCDAKEVIFEKNIATIY